MLVTSQLVTDMSIIGIFHVHLYCMYILSMRSNVVFYMQYCNQLHSAVPPPLNVGQLVYNYKIVIREYQYGKQSWIHLVHWYKPLNQETVFLACKHM